MEDRGGRFSLYLDGGSSTAVNGGRVGAIFSSTFVLGFLAFCRHTTLAKIQSFDPSISFELITI